MLKECFEQSIFAYSEPDNKGGQKRQNGTTHKAHPNVEEFRNYIGKVIIDGHENYVRFIVQVQKGQTGVHAYNVTDVDIYEKTASSLSVANNHGSRGTTSGKPVHTRWRKVGHQRIWKTQYCNPTFLFQSFKVLSFDVAKVHQITSPFRELKGFQKNILLFRSTFVSLHRQTKIPKTAKKP